MYSYGLLREYAQHAHLSALVVPVEHDQRQGKTQRTWRREWPNQSARVLLNSSKGCKTCTLNNGLQDIDFRIICWVFWIDDEMNDTIIQVQRY